MADKEFVNGLIVKAPHEKAPDFVKADMSIKREELIEWLSNKQEEWININVKESKGGKWYAEVNDWKPNGDTGSNNFECPKCKATPCKCEDFEDNDIPFS